MRTVTTHQALHAVAAVAAVAMLSCSLSMAAVAPEGRKPALSGADRVAGWANGQPVMASDVAERMSPVLRKAGLERAKRIQAGLWSPADEKSFMELYQKLFIEALGGAIVETVAIQEAERLKIRASESSIESRVQALLKRAGGPAQFASKYGMTPDALRTRLRRQQRIQRVRRLSSPARVQVRPSEVREYYAAHPAEFLLPEGIKLRVIVILKAKYDQLSDQAIPREGAKELAEKIALEAKAAPGTFDALARKHSDDTSTADRGGLLSSSTDGFTTADTIAEDLLPAAQALGAGEVSTVIESTGKYTILKLDEKRPAGTAPFKLVQDRITRKLEDGLHKKAQREWVGRLLDRSHVVDMRGRKLPTDVLLRAAFGDETENAGGAPPARTDTEGPGI